MADVVVNDNTPRNQYTATAAQTAFAYTFLITDEDDIVVQRTRSAEITTLAKGTEYTVAGVNNADGGTVTLVTGATAGDVITLYRDQALKRLTDFTTSGDFFAATLNTELDAIVLMAQQLERDIARAVRLKAGSVIDAADLEIPEGVALANKLIGFDNDGKISLLSSLTSGSLTVSAFMLTVLDDADAQAALTTMGAAPRATYPLINGSFDMWDYATTFTGTGEGYVAPNRWRLDNPSGRTVTVSRQAFAVGDALGNDTEEEYFCRLSATAGAGTVKFEQRMEDLRLFSGRTVYIQFYAKYTTNLTTNIEPQWTRNYGSGGSAELTNSSSDQFNGLSTAWQLFEFSRTVPDLTGKTVGADNFFAFELEINDTGAWDLDIAQFRLAIGGKPGVMGRPTKAADRKAALRYAWMLPLTAGALPIAHGGMQTTTEFRALLQFPVPMRAVPSVTVAGTPATDYQGIVANSAIVPSAVSGNSMTKENCWLFATMAATTQHAPCLLRSLTSTAKITVEAEL